MNTLCFILAALIIVHHYFVHEELIGLDRFIQLEDLNNHETFPLRFLVHNESPIPRQRKPRAKVS